MSLQSEFILDQVRRNAPPGATLLDFGCGGGDFVSEALRAGFDAHGCDRYGGPWAWLFDEIPPALRQRVKRIADDGTLPYTDASFDVVTSNQVFEHIAEFEQPLAEIARVLKAGGAFIAIFPGREIWFEPHVEMFFAHRFTPGSRPQRAYFSLMHRLGFGTKAPPRERGAWVERCVEQMRIECFYKTRAAIEAAFGRPFTLIRRGEADWLRHRVAHHRLLRYAAPLVATRAFDPMLGYLGRRLGGQVLILRRR